MKDNVRCSITIVAKKKGIDGRLMKGLLLTQHRLEGTPGNYRATKKYRQYEHYFAYPYGFCYDQKFFEGVKYTKRALKKAEKAMTQLEDCQVKKNGGAEGSIMKKLLAFWRN